MLARDALLAEIDVLYFCGVLAGRASMCYSSPYNTLSLVGVGSRKKKYLIRYRNCLKPAVCQFCKLIGVRKDKVVLMQLL